MWVGLQYTLVGRELSSLCNIITSKNGIICPRSLSKVELYKINCHDCDASYVGETGRALKTRVSEHRRAMEKRDFSASALAQHA